MKRYVVSIGRQLGSGGKEIAARLAKRGYRNAQRIFRCAFIYVIVVGGIGSAVCFFGAELFVGQNSAAVLRVFAPTIFLSGLLGVLRGYFQAHRTIPGANVLRLLLQKEVRGCIALQTIYLQKINIQ